MITCALPTYNNSRTLWLQLESLCRQECSVKWELIVMEETSQYYSGEEYVRAYERRLKQAGCVKITYIPCSRIPLGQKWKEIAERAQFPIYHLVAGDNYSPPNRLQISADEFSENDALIWCDWNTTPFLNVLNGKTAYWERADKSQTGLFMATLTKYVRELQPPYPPSSIDGWMRDSIPELNEGKRAYIDLEPNGLHTDGMNQISHHRRGMYREGKYQRNFRAWNRSLRDILPADIIDQMEAKWSITIA